MQIILLKKIILQTQIHYYYIIPNYIVNSVITFFLHKFDSLFINWYLYISKLCWKDPTLNLHYIRNVPKQKPNLTSFETAEDASLIAGNNCWWELGRDVFSPPQMMAILFRGPFVKASSLPSSSIDYGLVINKMICNVIFTRAYSKIFVTYKKSWYSN